MSFGVSKEVEPFDARLESWTMKTKVSKALREVWAMKDAGSNKETKHLKGVAYFADVHEQVLKQWPNSRRPVREVIPERTDESYRSPVPRVAEIGRGVQISVTASKAWLRGQVGARCRTLPK